MKNKFQGLVDDRLSGLEWTGEEKHKVISKLKGEKIMKKKLSLGFVVVAALLLVVVAALAITQWNPMIEQIFATEQKKGQIETWALKDKETLITAMQDGGYDMSTLPEIQALADEAKDAALTKWLNEQFSGEVASIHVSAMEKLKGFFDTWSLEDKAWYSGLQLQTKMVADGDFINTIPEKQSVTKDMAVSTSEALLGRLVNVSPDDLRAYQVNIFYGYYHPDMEHHYWLVHYRNREGNNLVYAVKVSDSPTMEAECIFKPITAGELKAMNERNEKAIAEKRSLLQQLEAERGPIITWTLEQKAAFDSDYGIPTGDDISEDEAFTLAKKAIHEKFGVSLEAMDAWGCYSFFSVLNPENRHFAVHFFSDPETARDLLYSVEVTSSGEVILIQGPDDGNG